jgi:hypothetical protein
MSVFLALHIWQRRSRLLSRPRSAIPNRGIGDRTRKLSLQDCSAFSTDTAQLCRFQTMAKLWRRFSTGKLSISHRFRKAHKILKPSGDPGVEKDHGVSVSALDAFARWTGQRPDDRSRALLGPRRHRPDAIHGVRPLQDRHSAKLDVARLPRRPTEKRTLCGSAQYVPRRFGRYADQDGHRAAIRSNSRRLDHGDRWAPGLVSYRAGRGSKLDPDTLDACRSESQDRNQLHAGRDEQSGLVIDPANHRRWFAGRLDRHDATDWHPNVPGHDSQECHLHQCAALHPSGHHGDDGSLLRRLLLSPLRGHFDRSDRRRWPQFPEHGRACCKRRIEWGSRRGRIRCRRRRGRRKWGRRRRNWRVDGSGRERRRRRRRQGWEQWSGWPHHRGRRKFGRGRW